MTATYHVHVYTDRATKLAYAAETASKAQAKRIFTACAIQYLDDGNACVLLCEGYSPSHVLACKSADANHVEFQRAFYRPEGV